MDDSSRSVSAGRSHTCGLAHADGELRCWGHDGYVHVPQDAGRDNAWSSVSAGLSHTCGVALADGALQCWGSNYAGQADVPSAVRAWSSVSAGGAHTCGVARADGALRVVVDGEDEEHILNISSDTDTTLNNTGNSSPFSTLSRESREPTPRMGDSVAAASPVSPTHVSAKRDSVKKSPNSTFNLLAWSNQDKASVSPKSKALPPTIGSGKRST